MSSQGKSKQSMRIDLGYWLLCLLMLSLLSLQLAWAVDNAPPLADPALQARYEALTHQLRCLVCQNETIADSGATLAADLRRELREKIVAGQTDPEILKFMTDRYGAFVLYKPPFEERTWVLWLGPAAFLVLGALIAVRIISRRAKLADNAEIDVDDGYRDDERNDKSGLA